MAVRSARGLKLNDRVAEDVVVPELGAGLAAYDLSEAGRPTPIFRPCRDFSTAQPFDLASNFSLSNRISGGGFDFGGKFHPLAPNIVGEPFRCTATAFPAPGPSKAKR